LKTHITLSVQQASLILAEVVCCRFPQAKIIKAWTNNALFFIDVVLGSSWEENYLPWLEEQIKKTIEADAAFEELEMSVAGAAAFFSAQNQDLLKAQLPLQKNALVQVLRHGERGILLPEEPQELVHGDFFTLVAADEVGHWEEEIIYRIKGVISSQPLKKKKELEPCSSVDPTHLIEHLKLLKQTTSGWSYLPKGEFAKGCIFKLWKKVLSQENFCFVSMPYGLSEKEARYELLEMALELQSDKLASLSYLEHEQPLFDYGVLTPKRGFQDLFCTVVSESKLVEAIISSLQLMRQIPRIFSFKLQTVLRASQTSPVNRLLQKALANEQYIFEPSASSQTRCELRWIDEEGCSWPGSALEVVKVKSLPGSRMAGSEIHDLWAVTGTLLGSWERALAIAAQKNGGIPFTCVEEQVRIFVLHADLRGYADGVRKNLENEGLRVQISDENGPLKGRIHNAIRERIPYLIVVGPKEKESEKISWRKCDSEEEKMTSVDEFLNKVKL
jgi:hypothetical protein